MTIFGIIFFIVLFLLFLYLENRYNDEIIIFPSIFGVAVVFISMLIFGGINRKEVKSNEIGVTYISSISVGSSVSGQFFLGGGTIEEQNYYFYVIDTKFGYKIQKIEDDGHVYVKEDCDKHPYIEFGKYKIINLNWFGKLFFKNELYGRDGEIIFHVPINTVIKNYNVDISNL